MDWSNLSEYWKGCKNYAENVLNFGDFFETVFTIMGCGSSEESSQNDNTAATETTVEVASDDTDQEVAEGTKLDDGNQEDFEVPERGVVFHVSKEMQDKGVRVEPYNENIYDTKIVKVYFYYTPETNKLFDKMIALEPEEQQEYAEEFYQQMDIHSKCLLYLGMLPEDVYQEAVAKGTNLDDFTGMPGTEYFGENDGYRYIISIPELPTDGMSDTEKALYEETREYMKTVKENIKFISVRLESDDTNVGDYIPDFSTTDLFGNVVTNQIFNEKDVTVVNVWGTFCAPCIEEMPELGKWASEMPENVQLIGLVSDVKGLDDEKYLSLAKKIVEKANANFPQLIAGGASFSGFMGGIVGVPTTFIVDSYGYIIGDPILNPAVEQYKERVEEYLNELNSES